MDSFYFFADSDLHFQKRESGAILPMEYKLDNISRIIKEQPDLVLVAGDLTNNGSDGSKILCIPISGPEKTVTSVYFRLCKSASSE